MGLGDLFKRLSKGSSEEDKKKGAVAGPRTKGGKALPPLPSYLKKDSFVRDPNEQLANFKPGEIPDMADAGSFKRPGQWLKNKLGGVDEPQRANTYETAQQILKKSGGLNDQEIQGFLDGLLDEDKGEAAPEALASKPPNPAK